MNWKKLSSKIFRHTFRHLRSPRLRAATTTTVSSLRDEWASGGDTRSRRRFCGALSLSLSLSLFFCLGRRDFGLLVSVKSVCLTRGRRARSERTSRRTTSAVEGEMASSLPRRIIKETQRLLQEPVPGITAIPSEDNVRHFHVSIEGPTDSPYEGGIFRLELFLPDGYPMDPPKVLFKTKIYHPNIDKLGRICLDVLKEKWSPALQIRTILLSVQALLSTPNPDDPLDERIAKHWRENEDEALVKAREMTKMHAMMGHT